MHTNIRDAIRERWQKLCKVWIKHFDWFYWIFIVISWIYLCVPRNSVKKLISHHVPRQRAWQCICCYSNCAGGSSSIWLLCIQVLVISCPDHSSLLSARWFPAETVSLQTWWALDAASTSQSGAKKPIRKQEGLAQCQKTCHNTHAKHRVSS